jgi:negative regulator of flagellin synthesis FlgM
MPRGIPPHAAPVQGTRTNPAAASGQAGRQGGDRVELSDRARGLLVANQELSRLPDIREDQVQALKQMVKAGAYQVSGEEVAKHMLGEGIVV